MWTQVMKSLAANLQFENFEGESLRWSWSLRIFYKPQDSPTYQEGTFKLFWTVMRVLHVVCRRVLQLMLVADFSNLCRDSPGKFLGVDPVRRSIMNLLNRWPPICNFTTSKASLCASHDALQFFTSRRTRRPIRKALANCFWTIIV